MKKILTIALCVGLLVNTQSTVKPITNKVHIGTSIAAAIATGLLTGSITYFIMNESEKKDEQYCSSIGDSQGLEEQKKRSRKKSKILIPLGVGLLGACIGGGATYWILYPYTGKAKVEKVDLLLDAVDQNGLLDARQDLENAFENIDDENSRQTINGFIRSNSNLSTTPFPAVQKKIDTLKSEIKNIEILRREAKKDDQHANTQEVDERITRHKNRIAKLENFILVNSRDQFEQQCVEHDQRRELNRHGKSYWENKERKGDKDRIHGREDKRLDMNIDVVKQQTNALCDLTSRKGEFLANQSENHNSYLRTDVDVDI